MKKVFKNFEEILCAFFLIIMVLLVILNVILRYAFNYSLFWSEEVATICFVWSVFIGAAAVYKHQMDIGIDVLIKKLSAKRQKVAQVIVRFLALIINAYIFYMSIVFTLAAAGKPMAVLGVSSVVINSALIFGFGLMTFHTLRFIRIDLRNITLGS